MFVGAHKFATGSRIKLTSYDADVKVMMDSTMGQEIRMILLLVMAVRG